MSSDIQRHEKSGLGKLLFFVFGGIGVVCLIGLVVFGILFNRHVDRCWDDKSKDYIQDEAARSEYCG